MSYIYHINCLLSSIINQTNKNVALIPKLARVTPHWHRGSMDHIMHWMYVSFAYLSKVNLGGKAVHWTRTLSQDSCSRNEPMHHTHLFPLLLSCPGISLTGLYNGMMKMQKIQNTGEPMPNFFLVLDLVFVFLQGISDPKYSSAIFNSPLSNLYIMLMACIMMDYT